MPSLLEQVARARDKRRTADTEFRQAIIAAHQKHSWPQIASVAGLTLSGLKWHTNDKRNPINNGSRDA